MATRLVVTGRLSGSALIVIEADRRDPWEAAAWADSGLLLSDERTYGDTALRFFEPRPAAASTDE